MEHLAEDPLWNILWNIFNSHLWRSFSLLLGKAEDMDSVWALFKASIAEATAESCGWRQPKNTLVDTGSEGGRQAEERGLSSLVGLLVSQFCRKLSAG